MKTKRTRPEGAGRKPVPNGKRLSITIPAHLEEKIKLEIQRIILEDKQAEMLKFNIS